LKNYLNNKGFSILVGLIILASIGISLSLAVSMWLNDISQTYNTYEYLRIFRRSYVKISEMRVVTADEPYGYYIPITISNPGSQDLTNYILSLNFDGKSKIFQHTQPDGSDIFFTYEEQPSSLEEAQKILYWIEYWDKVNAKGKIWIKVDIPAGQTITIYMHYGTDIRITQTPPDIFFPFYESFSGNSVDESKWWIPDFYKDKDKYFIINGELRIYRGDTDIPGHQKISKYFYMDTRNLIEKNIEINGRLSLQNYTPSGGITAAVELVGSHDDPFLIGTTQSPQTEVVLAEISVSGNAKKADFKKSIISKDRSKFNSTESDIRNIESINFKIRYYVDRMYLWDNLTNIEFLSYIPSDYQVNDYYLRIGADPNEGYVAFDYVYYRYVAEVEPIIQIGGESYYYPLTTINFPLGWRVRFKIGNQGSSVITLNDVRINGRHFSNIQQIANITAWKEGSPLSISLLYDSTSNINVFENEGFLIYPGEVYWIEIFILRGSSFLSGRSVEVAFQTDKGRPYFTVVLLP